MTKCHIYKSSVKHMRKACRVAELNAPLIILDICVSKINIIDSPQIGVEPKTFAFIIK